MKFGRKSLSQWGKGFTLLELLTVIAIIGILSAAMMVSLSVYKKRATASRLLLELSSVMQKVYLCTSDGNRVVSPVSAGGNFLCQDQGGVSLPNYGSWPSLKTGYQYISSGSFGNSWFYSVRSAGDNVKICCNSTYGKCNKFDSATVPCSETTQLN